MASIITAITAVGFAQFSMRGFAHPLSAPWWVHVHAAAMVTWLVLFVVQNQLAAKGNFALHRKLGTAGAVLVLVIVASGSFTAIRALELHRSPPQFAPAYFLTLTTAQMSIFAALVLAGIGLRSQVQYHRRLMLAATIVITASPGFGRFLTFRWLPGEQSELIVLAYAFILFAVIAAHDRKTLGRVHPATITGVIAISAVQLLPSVGMRIAAIQAVAERL
jgi:hypothetical protein